LPLEQQIDAIVEHAHEAEGLTRFAIIHPANSYGETARDLFAIALERRSLPVVRIVSYDPTATDFRTAAQELGQKDYKEARKEEYRKMIRDAEKENLDTEKLMLSPIIEFDALFVPDNHQRVPLVASALAYEEFPVGTFRPYRDAEPITLLGLNGWNNPKLVEAGGQYMINGLFVDAFLPSHADEGVQAFVSTYQETFERSPSVIDAVTYDTVRILGKAIATGADTRGLVRDAVRTTIIEGPAANGDHFGEDREMARDLLVLTISEEEGIVEWQAPEEEIPETEITTP